MGLCTEFSDGHLESKNLLQMNIYTSYKYFSERIINYCGWTV